MKPAAAATRVALPPGVRQSNHVSRWTDRHGACAADADGRRATPFIDAVSGDDESGSLNGIGFTHAQVTWAGQGDTANTGSFAPDFPCVQLSALTITVAGLPTVTSADQVVVYHDRFGNGAGFDATTRFEAILEFAATDSAGRPFGDRGVATALGPLDVTDDHWGYVATSGGLLVLASPTTGEDPVFQPRPLPAVPEPPIGALMAVGVLLVAALRHWRTTAA